MNNVRRHFLRLAGTALAVSVAPDILRAQTYPTRPVRMIVTTGPGGQGDTIARLLAQRLTEILRAVVLCGEHRRCRRQYRPRHRGAVGARWLYNPGRRWRASSSNPSLYAKIPYDPQQDFAPVTLVCSSPHVLAVHPSVPARSVAELVALVRKEPGKYGYASAGAGTPAHLAGELFKLALAIDLTHVPFNGGGPGIAATVAGHVPIAISALPTALPFAKSGAVRSLAVMNARRSAVLPDVPTMAEAGSPLEADILTGLLVRAGTSREIVDRLYRETAKAMNAARLPAAAVRTRVRAGGEHTRAIRRLDRSGDREMGQGHPRRQHHAAMKVVPASGRDHRGFVAFGR